MRCANGSWRVTFAAAVLLAAAMLLTNGADAINCYSGSQLQIIECSSLSCIKQTLGLDTVRYCDGQGASSICQTYRIVDTCQNIPNLGHVCCCSDHLCNAAPRLAVIGKALGAAAAVALLGAFLAPKLLA